MSDVDKDLILQLIEGKISRDNARRLIAMAKKDPGRFVRYVEVLQNRVPWPERILLRINDHLYVVRTPAGGRIVKCDCGREFGDYRENWKLHALINVRRTLAEFSEIYTPEPACPDPQWLQVREYFCPGCAAQLAVEAVPPGYPIVFEVLPDIDRFYRDFLGTPLDDEHGDWFQDRSVSVLQRWRDALPNP
jgi:acetone carboxylase gamma subunit